MKKQPGIFNDVIGPVMRGPSSSHTAASWRIARACLDILNEPLQSAIIDFDKEGAWAPNYREQGTCMGIDGGLLGLDIADDRIKNTDELALEMGISIRYEVNAFPTKHANTVRLLLKGTKGKKVQIIAASLGGGSFEIQQINGFDITISGDSFELLLWNCSTLGCDEELKKSLHENSWFEKIDGSEITCVHIKTAHQFGKNEVDKLKKIVGCNKVIQIKPVMPVIAGNEIPVPFTSVSTMLLYAEKEKQTLGDLGLLYEKCLSGLSKDQLFEKMQYIIGTISKSISIGLNGTVYKDRILHQQSHLIGKAEKAGNISANTLTNEIVANVTAIMEAKSAMEVIVANPTAGSCGTVGGVLKAVANDLNSSKTEIIKAYFAAGMAGVFFAQGPGFSAEEHGCQVECGAASGMAAAAIVQLFGGSAKQAIDAASMAIQNSIGMICDPVADRVEVPCLGKNVSAAMNALSSATMVCAGFDAVIPYNEVIETVSRVSKQMPSCVKCTGLGGLAVTGTAEKIKIKLAKRN